MSDGVSAGSPLAIYQNHLAEGRLAYQFSLEAGRAVFYPRVVCPFSGSDRLEWRIASGLATVHATTVVHKRGAAPYNVALVDCDEGFRMMTRIEEIPPEAVAIGARVRLRVRPDGAEPGGFLPCFVPLAPEASDA